MLCNELNQTQPINNSNREISNGIQSQITVHYNHDLSTKWLQISLWDFELDFWFDKLGLEHLIDIFLTKLVI